MTLPAPVPAHLPSLSLPRPPSTAPLALSGPKARRLGLHHVAYLRAIAEGVAMGDAAQRYLGIEHRGQAITAHRAVLALASSIARRRGDPRWRLLGLSLHEAPASVVSLDDWAQAQGLEDWPIAELQVLYVETIGPADPKQQRRHLRVRRLRAARLALLADLEATAAEQPHPNDLLHGWLAPALALELSQRGLLTLGELQGLIGQGGRWWRGLRAFGPVKAARLQQQVDQLLGVRPAPQWQLDATLSGAAGANRAPAGVARVDAADDRAAVRAWIAARAGSPLTATAYEREAERFLLWMVLERRKALSDATAEDCRGYMDFLAQVPAHWISRRHVPRLAPGWAPFSGALSVASQRHAIGVVSGLFQWLVGAGYLQGNPWQLVQRRVGDDFRQAGGQLETSRAFTPPVWAALLAQIERETHVAGAIRMRWLLPFAQATGLRPSELLQARREDFVRRKGAWWLKVHGKGARNRVVPVPSRALVATEQYLAARGLDFVTAPPETALLVALACRERLGEAALSYSSLHAWLKAFLLRALRSSSLTDEERRHAERGSAHWLRHTHATRAVEGGVPPDVLQANLGQADPRTTAGYYKAQLGRRGEEIERVFD